MNEVGFSGREWKCLGLALELYDTTLEAIEANHSGDEQRCLRECLVKWLKRTDGVNDEGCPRMTSLCRALEKIGESAATNYISKLLLY